MGVLRIKAFIILFLLSCLSGLAGVSISSGAARTAVGGFFLVGICLALLAIIGKCENGFIRAFKAVKVKGYWRLKQHKNLLVTSPEEKPPPRFSRVGAWVGGARKSGGIRNKFLFFFFLLGIAGGRYSDLKLLTLCVILFGNAKNGFRRACKALNVKRYVNGYEGGSMGFYECFSEFFCGVCGVEKRLFLIYVRCNWKICYQI